MALWLGVLDRPDLNAITAASYNSDSGFDSEEHNCSGLLPWEDSVIQQYFNGGQALLVAAAGGGREVIALTQQGFDITGFDCDPTLIAACHKHLLKTGCSARLHVAEPDRVPVGLGMYDGVIVGRGAYHHLFGRSTRIHFLSALRQHIGEGAHIFIEDFLVRRETDSGHQIAAVIANVLRRVRGSDARVEPGDILTSAFFHRFRRNEIEAELNEAGFRLEKYVKVPLGEGVEVANLVAVSGAST